MHTTASPPLLLLLFLTLYTAKQINVAFAAAGENPFTPKGYLLRYWKKQISTNSPAPTFLLDKASPLTAAQFAAFSKLADQNSLSTHLPDFCDKANLLCFPDLSPSLEKHGDNSNFATDSDKNFTNYGTGGLAGVSSFKGYTDDGGNVVVNTFRRYSRDSAGQKDKFSGYATDSNVVDQSFNTYGAHSTGGGGEFKNYNNKVNVPNLHFTSYSDNSNGRKQSFSVYTGDSNAGDQKFSGYGKSGNGAENVFSSYGNNSNVMDSTFTNYGEGGNAPNDTFTSYGTLGNVPENTFKNYGAGSNSATENFKNYRDQSNVGDDNFQSYGKKSKSAKIGFENYDQPDQRTDVFTYGSRDNDATDKFSGYSNAQTVGFKIYGVNNTFKEYGKKDVTFANYLNGSSPVEASLKGKRKTVNKWVEPGKFFREEMLKTGTIMPMPDIRDKMPKRSFLPRVIVSKLPFSTSKIGEMKKNFHAGDDSSMLKMITDSLSECERAPSPGEVKRCVASIEDMVDFSTSVLGRNVVVRTTESTQGSHGNIMIGEIRGINGGKVTKSVSCHQTLFPYLLYYCHSVPKVRVYEADIMDPKSKAKINHGVAICHLDTSSWSSTHGAFLALGSSPGKIEVCHWIFENDMTWAIAD